MILGLECSALHLLDMCFTSSVTEHHVLCSVFSFFLPYQFLSCLLEMIVFFKPTNYFFILEQKSNNINTEYIAIKLINQDVKGF
jgi:hypothetical protein